MDYSIWAPPYHHFSGGIRALHELGEKLAEKGFNPLVGQTYEPGTIAIYPEVVSGNPFNAKYVVRWCLNVPGRLGGEDKYDPAELVFTWSEKYLNLPKDRILKVDVIDPFFTNNHLKREGDCFWSGKGPRRGCVPGPEVEGMEEITYSYPAERTELADLLNKKKRLYSYDDCTAMLLEALLCGCEVILLPENKQILLEDVILRDDYDAELDNFIKITQGWVTT